MNYRDYENLITSATTAHATLESVNMYIHGILAVAANDIRITLYEYGMLTALAKAVISKEFPL